MCSWSKLTENYWVTWPILTCLKSTMETLEHWTMCKIHLKSTMETLEQCVKSIQSSEANLELMKFLAFVCYICYKKLHHCRNWVLNIQPVHASSANNNNKSKRPQNNHSCSNHSNLEMEAECLTKTLSYLNLNISRTKNGRNKL